MTVRMRVLPLLVLLSASLALADGKKKVSLPAYVLQAHTVYVLIDPTAGTSITSPLANKTALEDVEKALMKWGRFSLATETQTADLIITVRKGSGKIVDRTIAGEPTNDRPVIVQATDDSIRVGAHRGRPPDAAETGQIGSQPHPQTEVGPPDDIFVVYEGHVASPLEQAPVWEYEKKDALKSPSVPAVGEFRKAVDEAVKQQKPKP